MKIIQFCLLLTVLFKPIESFSQNDSIFSRDTTFHRYRIGEILKEYEALLTLISTSDAIFPEEFEGLIIRKFSSDEIFRLFLNKDVIIENDLNPDSPMNNTARNDVSVESYLRDFNSLYSKSDSQSVFIKPVAISNLKFSSYYYYTVEANVLYTNYFEPQSSKYKPFKRIFEFVCIKSDSSWKLYISSIRFPKKLNETSDTKNNFKKIYSSKESLQDQLNSIKRFEDERKSRERILTTALLEDAELLYLGKNYAAALSKLREARLLNQGSDEISLKIKEYQDAYNIHLKEQERLNNKSLRDKNLFKLAHNSFDQYNVNQARLFLDSMNNKYEVSEELYNSLFNDISWAQAIQNQTYEYLKRNDYARAKESIAQTINESSKSVKLWRTSYSLYLKSYIEFNENKNNPNNLLIEDLNESIRLSGTLNMPALRLRAEIQSLKSNFPASIRDITTYLDLDKSNSNSYYFAAKTYLNDTTVNFNRIYQADSLLTMGLGFSKSNAEIYLLKAFLSGRLKNYENSLQILDQAINAGVKDNRILIEKATFHYKLGEYNSAGELFRRVKKRIGQEDSINVYITQLSTNLYEKGITYFSTQNYNDALKYFDYSIQIDSSEKVLFETGILCYQYMRQFDKALKYFNALLYINPKFNKIHYNLGLTYFKLKDFENAIKNFQIEIDVNHDDILSYYYKGVANLNSEKYNEAKDLLEYVVKKAPSDSAFLQISKACFLLGEFTESVKHARKGLKLNKKNPMLNHIWASAQQKIKITKKISKRFDKALKYGKDEFQDSVRFSLVQLYSLQGEYEKCIYYVYKLKFNKRFNPMLMDYLIKSLLFYNNSKVVKKVLGDLSNTNVDLSTTSMEFRSILSLLDKHYSLNYFTKNTALSQPEFLNHDSYKLLLAYDSFNNKQCKEGFRNLDVFLKTGFLSKEEFKKIKLFKSLVKKNNCKNLRRESISE